MPSQHTVRTVTLIATAAAALLLAACGRDDNKTVGQKIDAAITTSEQKAEQAKVEASQQMAELKAAAERATGKVAQSVAKAADSVGDSVANAAVTARINAELAKDPKLSALRIDVDTSDGRVSLSGKAPDAESRERASRLAQGVKGVTSVDNRLQIGG